MNENRQNISNLDFISIKSSLIDFLSNQTEFKGYSFEGASMNVLMDLLSYNTYYSAFYNNLAINESFLDSAQKRNSVISISKNLGYIPASSVSAKAKINIKIAAEDYTGEKILRNTVITAINSANETIPFTVMTDHTLSPYEYDIDDPTVIVSYAATDVDIRQGVLASYTHIVSDPLAKIKLPYTNIETDTIRAMVLLGINDVLGFQNEWNNAKNITEVDSESKIFFVNEENNGIYQIQFGDGIFGKKLSGGNVVVFEFLITSGLAGNDIGKMDTQVTSSFTLSGYEIETVQYSNNGSNREGIESVRRNALKNFSVQERAVTASDYEATFIKLFPNIESIRCWGGEDSIPPQYGTVIASIKPKNAPFLTNSEKMEIIEQISRTKAIVGTNIQIKDPDILYLNVILNVKYDPSITLDTEENIKQVIIDKSTAYVYSNYKGFDDDFYSSDFIKNSVFFHSSIASVLIDAKIEKRIYPVLGISNGYTLKFGNKLYKPNLEYTTVSSNGFYTNIISNGALIKKVSYIEDSNGILNVYYYDLDAVTAKIVKVLISTIGTVNYETGEMIINRLTVDGFYNDINHVAIKCITDDDDVFTDKNTVFAFDKYSMDNIVVNMKKVTKNTMNNISAANRIYGNT